MKVFAYKIQPGDTLGSIAYRYTGKKDRWVEMLEINPQIPKQWDDRGQKQFVPRYIQVYGRIFLPASWANGAGYVSGPASGTVGEACSPDAVTPHPYAWYKIQGSEMPSETAYKRFGKLKDGGFGDDHTLNGANSDDPAGFTKNSYGDCVMARWKAGELIRVPNEWLDVAGPYFPKNALPYLYLSDGKTKWTQGYVPTGDTVPPKVGPGGNTCPDGYILDPTTQLCVKGAATPVGAKDEGFFKGNAIWWILLAGGAGIGGALLLNQLIKSKKIHSPFPPSQPAMLALPEHKVETVVRR
jgi:hypothetical protein